MKTARRVYFQGCYLNKEVIFFRKLFCATAKYLGANIQKADTPMVWIYNTQRDNIPDLNSQQMMVKFWQAHIFLHVKGEAHRERRSFRNERQEGTTKALVVSFAVWVRGSGPWWDFRGWQRCGERQVSGVRQAVPACHLREVAYISDILMLCCKKAPFFPASTANLRFGKSLWSESWCS